ncbi:MAG TPA: hypothetical protein VH682_00345 [Gemmataceae bacterium]
MFNNWFGSRTSRPFERSYSFRPELECLEDRMAPSSLMPMGPPGPPPGPGPHGPPPPAHGPPPPGPGPVNTIGQNSNHSFNGSTITDSFNNTINNTVILMPAQQSAVGGLFAFSGLLASTLNNPQLGSLINEEIALAVDKYLDAFPAVQMSPLDASLKNDIMTLTNAINAPNSLGSTPVGSAIGMVVFNVTTSALTSAQPTI